MQHIVKVFRPDGHFEGYMTNAYGHVSTDIGHAIVFVDRPYAETVIRKIGKPHKGYYCGTDHLTKVYEPTPIQLVEVMP